MSKETIKRGIVFGDLHAPYQDEHAVEILKQVIQDVKPHVLIDLGDTSEFESINHYDKNKPLKLEGKRLTKDIERVEDILSDFRTIIGKDCQFIHLTGNHCERLIRYVEAHAELAETFDIDVTKRVVNFKHCDLNVPHGRFYNEGKLMFHHGDRRGYQSIHHAKQWAQIGRSVVYGHFHSVQRFPHETLKRDGTTDSHAAFGIGCLCIRDRDWMYNQKSVWQQSFGVFYLDKEGFFSMYNVDIVNRRAIWNGKVYRG
jgi:hypothetical protein